MANKEELKTMIKCFRVNELQLLLTFAGRSKYGKKRELQDRAISLLKLPSQPLEFKIRFLYNLMRKSLHYHSLELNPLQSSTSLRNKNKRSFGDKDDDSIAIIDDDENNKSNSCNEKTQSCTVAEASHRTFESSSPQSNSSLQLTMNPLYYSVHPNVKFKKLPFYKVLHELLKPASLVPEGYNMKQKYSFVFYLTPEQTADFHLNSSKKQGFQGSETVQAQLRFCLLETSSKQEDCLPDGLIVMVNDKFCKIEELPKKKKKDVYTSEPSIPINITSLMNINSTDENKIDIFWNTNYNFAHVVGVYIVQKKSFDDLLNRLKEKSVRSPDYTRGMIKEKLREEADSEIVTTSLRVSLSCPLGKIRLRTPCRATTCQHLQCFDASLFLQMNEMKPSWICPVCDKPAEYDTLFIDGYFLDILSCNKLPSDRNEIELHSDGSWSSVEIKVENCSDDGTPNIKMEPELEVIDVLVDDSSSTPCENSTEERNHCAASKTSSSNLEKRKVDEIDLTVSDSDDEPLIYYKRRELLKNKNIDVLSSSTNSVASSPSIIQLDDSDSSSDSLALVLSNSVSDSASASGVNADFHAPTDVKEDSAVRSSKGSDGIMPWFTDSAVFF